MRPPASAPAPPAPGALKTRTLSQFDNVSESCRAYRDHGVTTRPGGVGSPGARPGWTGGGREEGSKKTRLGLPSPSRTEVQVHAAQCRTVPVAVTVATVRSITARRQTRTRHGCQ